MTIARTAALLLLIPTLGLAQATSSGQGELPPPPLVNAGEGPGTAPAPATAPPPAPAPAPGELPGTPPPPGATPPPPGTVPYGGAAPFASPPYAPGPYAPYGQTGQAPKPPPEVGIMVSETLFGALTSAGTALIPYYLLLKPLAYSAGTADPGMVNLLTILVFGAVPLAVAETELGIANGSAYYHSETWPAALAGLATEAGVLGLAVVTNSSGGNASELILLIGTIGAVPLAEMAVTNLTKTPRGRMMMGGYGAALSYTPDHGLVAQVPVPAPFVSSVMPGVVTGISLPLLAGRF